MKALCCRLYNIYTHNKCSADAREGNELILLPLLLLFLGIVFLSFFSRAPYEEKRDACGFLFFYFHTQFFSLVVPGFFEWQWTKWIFFPSFFILTFSSFLLCVYKKYFMFIFFFLFLRWVLDPHNDRIEFIFYLWQRKKWKIKKMKSKIESYQK